MGYYHSIKKQEAIKKGVHLMNKNEAKMLRKIMAESGLTKEQVLEVKEYRVRLSEAQDAGEKQHSYQENLEKRKKRLLKAVTKRLKLAKEHPLVVAEYKKLIETRLSW